ncbi:unnamed protein product [Medioppia subpectinata]|uniref:Protein Skeletor n=1 Tax=Medioppia subpectinata TaxID=1979941 RepID=A0A7R9KEP9_9ACAR|nr:unnamed protein product [Medioppia subpectinata]CAG2101971.1 unnamed protein product [Medioppia subpectinata]
MPNVKLNAYNKQNILLTLPKGKTLRDIKWIAVWCQLFTVNFGHVNVPYNFPFPKEQNLGPIPTLGHRTHADAVIIKDEKTLFIRHSTPDAFFLMGTGNKPHEHAVKIPDENGSLNKIRGYRGVDITLRLPDNHTVSSFPNCETIFADQLQVSWEVRHPDIYIQLEGRVGTTPDQYISFGLSGSTQRAQMVGADVVVVFYDSVSQKAKVVDYTLTAKAQCAPQSNSGACPDQVVGGRQDSELILWHYNDGVLKVSYKRKLYTRDDVADEEIIVTNPMVVVAAIGPLNSKKEAAFHNIEYTRASDKPIKILFGKLQNERNCDLLSNPSNVIPSAYYSTVEPWNPSVIYAQNNQVFRVVIGPAGGDRGYTPITGVQSWGIAYWVDDKLIPEIHVQRGDNYTFVVEAGNNPSNQAKYHPLYITDNREGGGGQRPQELNTPNHMVYAGVDLSNSRPDPSPGAGRYCELQLEGIDTANVSNSIEEYRKTLKLIIVGNVATFTWSPDETTPDIVYYQCFTHRNLGWKIVVNSALKLQSLHYIFSIVFPEFAKMRLKCFDSQVMNDY